MKKLTLLSFMMGTALSINASPISPEEALGRLVTSGPTKLKTEIGGLHLIHTSLFKEYPTAYIFEKKNGGFLILSADNNAYPILGYSDSGSFNANNIPPQLQYWLDEYGRQIEYFAEQKDEIFNSLLDYADPSWESISPMVETKWNQDKPYNKFCPVINGSLCPTGCVATSMSQIMNYYKYPEVGKGNLSYDSYGAGRLTLNLANQPFDWDNMLNYYVSGGYTDQQADAVAYLMQACGYSVKMNYAPGGSGAVSIYIGDALVNNFGYDPSLHYEWRELYSTSEWTKMIYENLRNVGPLIYDGTDSAGGGHSFICDGYDGEGFFHFNWGWGGISDGYFSLDALNPGALGTGGGSGGGFNFDQGIYLGITTPKGGEKPENERMLGMSGAAYVDSQNGNSIVIGMTGAKDLSWLNYTNTQIDVKVALDIHNINGGESVYAEGTILNKGTLSLSAGTYMPYYNNGGRLAQVNVTVPSNLPDGSYKATLVNRDAYHSSYPWFPVAVPYSYPNYILLEKSGDNLTATSVEIPQVTIESLELLNDVYFNRNVTVRAEIFNQTEWEITHAYSLVLLSGNEIVFKGGTRLLTSLPNESTTEEWFSSLTKVGNFKEPTEDIELTLGLLNESIDEMAGTFGTIVMHPNPGVATVQLRKLALENCERIEEMINGQMQYIYVVPDKENFTAELTFKVSKGYFDSTFEVGINQMSPENPMEQIPVIEDLFSTNLFMIAGEEETFNIPISFPQAEADIIYYLEARYYTNYSTRSMGSLRFRLESAGINNISDGSINDFTEYYNLQGIKIENPAKGELIIEKRGNKSRKIIF